MHITHLRYSAHNVFLPLECIPPITSQSTLRPPIVSLTNETSDSILILLAGPFTQPCISHLHHCTPMECYPSPAKNTLLSPQTQHLIHILISLTVPSVCCCYPS